MDRMIIVVLICALVYFGVDKFVLAPRREAAMLVDCQAASVDGCEQIDCGAAVHRPESHARSGIFLRRHGRGNAERLGQGEGPESRGPHVVVFVQGQERGYAHDRQSRSSVANILEGSVRKQGDKVRITAQLIQVSDGFHLWSESYDGDLSDVFKLQERIARAITDQLKVVLEGDQKTQLVPVGTSNSEAYTLYLQATAALNERDYPKMGEAIGWLEKALQLDPNFARAHARLAMMHVIGQSPYGASETEAEKHARHGASRSIRSWPSPTTRWHFWRASSAISPKRAWRWIVHSRAIRTTPR